MSLYPMMVVIVYRGRRSQMQGLISSYVIIFGDPTDGHSDIQRQANNASL